MVVCFRPDFDVITKSTEDVGYLDVPLVDFQGSWPRAEHIERWQLSRDATDLRLKLQSCYLGAETQERDGKSFEDRMKRLVCQNREHKDMGARMGAAVAANLEAPGFGVGER